MKQLNTQQKMDKLLEEIKLNSLRPTLLLHVCCAPCSSYVLEYLSEYFDITVFYYNPNIEPENEYYKRIEEVNKLISLGGYSGKVRIITGNYDNIRYHQVISGLEQEPERGRRCDKCFELRLEETAILAARDKYDYFTTTLSISPHKNAALLNRIGEEMGEKHHVNYLPSDFKKRGGYLRSIELSREYDLYRQDYCGCIYSQVNKCQGGP